MLKTAEKTKLEDIFDFAYLQNIQDNFSRVVKLSLLMLDSDGIPVTESSNRSLFCVMMSRPSWGQDICRETKQNLIGVIRKTRKPAALTCPLTGLKTGAVPIFINGQYLGCWLLGQVRIEGVENSRFLEAAEKAGFNREEAGEALEHIPFFTEREFYDCVDFLKIIMDEMIKVAEASENIRVQNEKLVNLSNKIQNSSNAFRTMVDLSDVGLYVTDFYSGEIILCNNTYASTIGLTCKEANGKICYSMLGYDSPCPFCPAEYLLDENGEPGKPHVWENYVPKFNKWLRLSDRALRWTDGRLVHMCTYIDITERKKLEEEISYLAYYDQRLKIPNALRLFQDIQEHTSENYYLICFDIKDLHRINEVYSRDVGDLLVESVVSWIQYFNINNEFRIYRMGGKSFGVYIQKESPADVRAFARRISDRFTEPWHVELGSMNQNIFIEIAIGVFPCGKPFESYSELVNVFERIMVLAHRNPDILWYDEDMSSTLQTQLRMELLLKDCVLNSMEGFSLNYQPLADPRTGTWCGLEVLCRWTMPGGGPVPPDVFIRQAEQMGLIGLIGEWTLRESLAQVKKWGLDTLESFKLHVNLSPIQLNSHNLCKHLIALIHEQEYPPEKLSLEITESAEVTFNDYTLESLDLFCKAGISLSLDDFGTGYASFSNLRNLPVTEVKADRSFITTIETDAYLQQMIYILVEFAHGAGLKIVAEGVENSEQMDILLKNRVDFFQGYLFSKPLSPEDLSGKLHNFYSSEGVFPVRTVNPVDMELMKTPEGTYITTPHLSRLLNYSLHYFTNELDLAKALDMVLSRVGEEFRVSRGYVFALTGASRALKISEWLAPGVETRLERGSEVTLSDDWLSALRNQGIILSSDMRYFSEKFRDKFARRDVNSIVVLPLWGLGALTGFMGFEVASPGKRDWFPEEVEMLYHLGLFVSWALREESLFLKFKDAKIRLGEEDSIFPEGTVPL
ncbi:EAL domain-containing protein [Breznakiella homolactica]|uniref:EAL domain-containing protein n=1 Tax=Breznakiella homolactica TaxID=2798577 RepID=A0A7T8B888_9SPIR|nr:EAL domain-containing protein [Breznakiella homolactica]QQO08329.1 EAL domain-containing protein [Breznakiella homolactica]